jgi:hypothetical protein
VHLYVLVIEMQVLRGEGDGGIGLGCSMKKILKVVKNGCIVISY